MIERLDPPEIESLIEDSEGSSPSLDSGGAVESSPRRVRALMAVSMIVGLFLCLNGLSTSTDAQPATQSPNQNSNTIIEATSVDAKTVKTPPPATSSSRAKSNKTDTTSTSKQAKPAITTETKSKPSSLKKKKLKALKQTCQVPVTDSSIAKCGKNMGLKLPQHRKGLVKHLPMNPQAHLFTFHHNVRDSEGLRPLLCVPQKNGNKQFGGFVFAAWNKKAAKSGYEVDTDMSHWQQHHLLNSSKSHHTHVYFVARNPYTRILSMYLQKVVNACISDGQKGCDKPKGWHNIKRETSFKEFVEIIEKKLVKQGSLCAISHHLCQQVETCLTTTLTAKEVTVIRVEEESCWFPCLVKQVGTKTQVLNKGWEEFSGHSCYYTSTGKCDDMLRSIDPDKVGVVTGNVHATGASNRLAEHYDKKTAETISRLYADDFRVLGYPLWDGESKM